MDKLKQKLKDCGISDDQLDAYLEAKDQGNNEECVKCLCECRKSILDDIYKKKNQMCNLDSLINDVKEEVKND